MFDVAGTLMLGGVAMALLVLLIGLGAAGEPVTGTSRFVRRPAGYPSPEPALKAQHRARTLPALTLVPGPVLSPPGRKVRYRSVAPGNRPFRAGRQDFDDVSVEAVVLLQELA